MSVLIHLLLFLELHTYRFLPLALRCSHTLSRLYVVLCNLYTFLRIHAAETLTAPTLLRHYTILWFGE